MIMSSTNILEVEGLKKVFSQKRLFPLWGRRAPAHVAIQELSFALKEGEILGILGSNGAGKTTLIEMLLGTLKPTGGTIRYFGKDFFKHRSETLERVCHMSAYHKFPHSLTVKENLEIIAGLYGIKRGVAKERIDELLKQFGMESFRDKQAGTLSAGQITRVMLIKVFLPKPHIILLDEPTASLDPDIAQEVRNFILQQQKEHNVSMILTSHNMREVAQICDRALVLQKGEIIEEDTPEKLAQSVSLTQVTLTITERLEQARSYLAQENLPSTLYGNELKIEIDEAKISSLLKIYAERGIDYSRIDIHKPTLEDYFLKMSQPVGTL